MVDRWRIMKTTMPAKTITNVAIASRAFCCQRICGVEFTPLLIRARPT
jgi:hypothetical protein